MTALPGGCNPADVLFKLAHARGMKAPVFDQVSELGPPHAKTFTWGCSFFEGKYQSVGQGRSKKEARNASAKSLIEQLDLSTLPQKPQRHSGGRQGTTGGKRKMPNDGLELGGEHGGSLGQPGSKKNRGMMPLMPGMMGGVVNPRFGAVGGNYMGQEFIGMGGMDMGMCGMPGMGMETMMGMGGFQGGMNRPRNFRPYVSVEDKHVMERHQEVYPDEVELDTILMLVDTIEKALKRVSDKLIEKEGEVEERKLTGVARVGDLAKGLLLKGDKEVNLVVMCDKKPTISLMETITVALKQELEEVEGQEGVTTKYEVHMFPEEGGLCVTSSELGEAEVPYQVTVSLTSTVLRNTEEGDVVTPGLLPRDKGLLALAELRHSKWFTAMASNLSSCVESIRILKDLAQREPAWASLGGWALELLVERALYSAGMNLSPSRALMRILEVVAGGILMVDGPGIKDPCEREETCVFSHLTDQMREDVTRQAQQDIRNVHYRKIHLVLGMERLPTPSSSSSSLKDQAKTDTDESGKGKTEAADEIKNEVKEELPLNEVKELPSNEVKELPSSG